MRAQHLAAIALAIVGSPMSTQAHEFDAGGRIELPCAGGAVRMAAITDSLEKSQYWAPQTARRRMLSLAQQACARGATAVTFVAPAVPRPCRAPPTWSTLCIDGPAAVEPINSSMASLPTPRN